MRSRFASRQGAKAPGSPRRPEEDVIVSAAVDEAVKIHRDLGPGLLESVYEAVLAKRLTDQGMQVKRQVSVPLVYEGIKFKEAFRADIVVNEKVILELKAVEKLTRAHKKQLLTYLKLSELRVGLLLNFSEELMKHGISRVVNQFDES
ncbi:GxxExxY protein [Wenzhouxiangella sp. XN201]|nr:GxxExxY protein [Wenzhouxiangella sp. XN201]